MNPEDLTTHALGEPLSPADREALEQTLQTDAQTRADFEATQAFSSFLQQNLATDHPEATLTDEQKQRLLNSSGASGSLAQNEVPRAGRPTTLHWLTRAALPLSAAALVVLGFQQWQKEIPQQDLTSIELQQQGAVNWASPPGATQYYSNEEGNEPVKPLPVDTAKVAELAENNHPDLYNAPQKQAELLKAETVGKTTLPPILIADDADISPGTLGKDAILPPSPSQSKGNPITQSGLIASNNLNEAVTISSVTVPYTGTTTFQAPTSASTVETGLLAGKSNLEMGNYDRAREDYLNVLRKDPYNSAARRGMEAAERQSSRYYNSARDHTRARMLNEVNQAWESPAPSPSIGNKPATASAPLPQSTAPLTEGLGTSDAVTRRKILADAPYDRSTESYTPIQENALTAVLREPLSTFSIDVDTASYANTRRFLNRSSLPPRDAVRIEELVNYFPYNLEGPAPESPHPFAVHVEVADCPWQPQHRLARIGIQGKKIGLEQRNSNFVFLVDVSGSMNQPDKLPLVKESLRLLVEQLDEKDRVSLVTYAGSSGLVLPPTSGDQKDRILAAIDNMTSGGSTHGSAGIQLAYEQAIAGFIPEGVNRVILCSDGDFNVGISSPQELEKLITEKARSGVFLSVLGYGTGNLKDRTMETLADKGNGNYGYIDSLSEARKVLVDQMTGTLITIAKDVKIQVEFNPAQVASYRLIGYENRLLAKEDFNDDTKDAGEIGAGHSVTALYEIVPVGVTPPTAPVDPLKYQTSATVAGVGDPGLATTSPDLLTVKLRYKAPDGDISQLIEVPVTDPKTALAAASPEFKFSTAVAAYGLMLRQSSYRANLTWEQIRQLALEGKGNDPHGYRAEFLQLLDKARGLMPEPSRKAQ
jgi:secreted protein with Ig-like and vWFA domain